MRNVFFNYKAGETMVLNDKILDEILEHLERSIE